MSDNNQKPASPAKKDEKDGKNADGKDKPKGKDAPKEEELVSIHSQSYSSTYRTKKTSN